MLLWWGVGKSPSSSLSCDPFPLDFYALGLWYSLGYARFGGRFVISGLGKHNSNIWNLVLGCLMWIVWLERNRCSFEDKEKTLDDSFYAIVVFWSGLVVRVLLIVLLFLSFCPPLA